MPSGGLPLCEVFHSNDAQGSAEEQNRNYLISVDVLGFISLLLRPIIILHLLLQITL